MMSEVFRLKSLAAFLMRSRVELVKRTGTGFSRATLFIGIHRIATGYRVNGFRNYFWNILRTRMWQLDATGLAPGSLRCYTAAMALNTSVPVRFDKTQTERLRAISDQSRIPVSQLIRMAVDKFLDKSENSGQVEIPLGRDGATTGRSTNAVDRAAKRAKT